MESDDRLAAVIAVTLMVSVFVGIPLAVGTAALMTSTPESECRSACGERGVKRVTAEECNCRE